jgi:hypothetical protein
MTVSPQWDGLILSRDGTGVRPRGDSTSDVRQLDRYMSGGAHHNRASIGGEALEHFQNQKKLLSKHGRKPRSELTNDGNSDAHLFGDL